MIVVARLGKTTRESASHLREQLEHLSANVIGVVVNALQRQRGYSYGYGYGYALDDGYLADDDADRSNGNGTVAGQGLLTEARRLEPPSPHAPRLNGNHAPASTGTAIASPEERPRPDAGPPVNREVGGLVRRLTRRYRQQ